ncbi:MAG: hypothetical protein RR288_04190 [Oscillibacter sp.]
MKRLALTMCILSMLALLAGCGNKPAEPETPDTPAPGVEDTTGTTEGNEAIMADFTKLLDDNAAEADVLAYISANIAQVSKDEADTMIRELGNLFKKNLPALDAQYATENENLALADAFATDMEEKYADEITDPVLKEFVKNTYKNGYLLMKDEGYIYPAVNTEALEQYAAYTSTDIATLLALK